jgi:hypothetical protein
LAVRQRDQGVHQQGRVRVGIVEGAVEQSDGFGPVVLVQLHSGHQVDGDPPEQPRRQRVDGRLQQRASTVGVACLEVVLGGPNSACRGVAAEPDREINQFRSGGRRATVVRRRGGVVERRERFRIRAGGGQRHVPGPQLGLLDGARKLSMHRPALRRSCVGVDASGQQRVSEPDVATINSDEPLGFCFRDHLTGALHGIAGDSSEELDGRVGDRRRGQ